jgi:hypothetical protein
LSLGALAVAATVIGCGHNSPLTATATTTPPTTTHLPTSAPAATETWPLAPTTDPYPGAPLIDHVLWTSTDRGRQLRVFPTEAGRRDFFPAAGDRAWAEVVADAPGANTPGMRDQFLCHWNFARLVMPDKPSWNLEPWRPDVGYDATVAAACNPGGPEN